MSVFDSEFGSRFAFACALASASSFSSASERQIEQISEMAMHHVSLGGVRCGASEQGLDGAREDEMVLGQVGQVVGWTHVVVVGGVGGGVGAAVDMGMVRVVGAIGIVLSCVSFEF